jgi:hypothetical protein
LIPATWVEPELARVQQVAPLPVSKMRVLRAASI